MSSVSFSRATPRQTCCGPPGPGNRLLGARNLRDIQQAALSISRSMRDEATDWYSVVHSQDVELPT